MRKGGPPKKKKVQQTHINKYADMKEVLGNREIAFYNSMVETISQYPELEDLNFYEKYQAIKSQPTKENYGTMRKFYNITAQDAKSKGKDITKLL